MAAAHPAEPTARIAVSPDTDPLVQAHIEHAAGQVVGETHNGDDCREALAWARARTDRVYLRFDDPGTTYWAGAAEPHRVAAFWAAVTGGAVERAGVLGRLVDRALAAQGGVHSELLVGTREPAGQLTLTVEVGDLAAKVRWLRDLGGTVLQETAGAALVEDPEGNRALLVEQRPDPPGGHLRRPRLRP
jgi:hypothetical protein